MGNASTNCHKDESSHLLDECLNDGIRKWVKTKESAACLLTLWYMLKIFLCTFWSREVMHIGLDNKSIRIKKDQRLEQCIKPVRITRTTTTFHKPMYHQSRLNYNNELLVWVYFEFQSPNQRLDDQNSNGLRIGQNWPKDTLCTQLSIFVIKVSISTGMVWFQKHYKVDI